MTLSGLLPVLSVIIKMDCWQMSEPGELWYSPFPPAPPPKKKKNTKKNPRGWGMFYF
jgi:hypothetical protein